VKIYVAVEALRKNRREDETQFRVNMPPTKHHLVIERPSCADQRQSMVALVLISVVMQHYDWVPSFDKNEFEFFHIIQNDFYFIFLCVVMGVRKSNNQKNDTMLYIVMFGGGRGPTHCNAHTRK
jgi:hypothetical protein